MSDISVESGIPMPAIEPRGGRPPIYPFADLKPADSFWVPLNGRTEKAAVQTIQSAARRWSLKRAKGARYLVKPFVRDGVKGVRCWLVKLEDSTPIITAPERVEGGGARVTPPKVPTPAEKVLNGTKAIDREIARQNHKRETPSFEGARVVKGSRY